MTDCVATIGTFDGVHLGHRAILGKVRKIAAKRGREACAITFSAHPLAAIAPERTPMWAVPRCWSLARVAEYVDKIVRLDFTREMASMTALEFMKFLRDKFGVTVIVMGYDNTFGSDRLSTHEEYEAAGRAAGIEVVFEDAVMISDGSPASSSRLRRAIAGWDLPVVTELLEGYPSYDAEVVRGRQLGRQLGFPTMNLTMPNDMVPIPDGVYLAEMLPEGWPAVLSVGTNPTVGDSNVKSYELHVPGVNLGDMYGRRVRFLVREKIRDIRKFAGLDELKEAIEADIKRANDIYYTNR